MLLGPTMDPRIAAELALRLPHLGLRIQVGGETRTACFDSMLEHKDTYLHWDHWVPGAYVWDVFLKMSCM
jgi:hypothetical protein